MASYVSSVKAASITGTSISIGVTASVGDMVVIFCTSDLTVFSGISSTLGNTLSDVGDWRDAYDTNLEAWSIAYVGTITTGGADTYTIGVNDWRTIHAVAVVVSGVTDVDDVASQYDRASPFTPGTVTPGTENAILVGYAVVDTSGSFTPGGGFTTAASETAGGQAHTYWTGYKVVGDTDPDEFSLTGSGFTEARCVLIALSGEAGSRDLIQSRYRWGDDDGSESGHGWLAAENADLML